MNTQRKMDKTNTMYEVNTMDKTNTIHKAGDMRKINKAILFSALLIALAFALAACGGGSGGSNAAGSQNNISVVAREDGSGTKTAFMEIIGLKGKADPVNVVIQTGTQGVLAAVKSDPSAIAYESLGYVDEEVKALAIDGVEATVANIQNGTYKISRPLSVVYKDSALADAINNAFYVFLKSSTAQEIISKEGYVSVAEGASPYTIDGSLSGRIDISGSTSLQPLMIELAAAFEDLQSNVIINVSGGGSGTGYKNADEGVSAFGMISEEFALDKAPGCTHYTVAKDGIAVIVNKGNTVNGITMEQLNRIYDEEAGENAILNWGELSK